MRKMRFWLAAALLFLAAAPASATTVLRVPVEEMARGADLVVRAVVGDVLVQTDPDDSRSIRTRVRFEVREVLKGHAAGPNLTITFPGGANDRWTLHVPGMPAFAQGEEVVLFLERTRRGWTPAALSLGKFVVTRGDAGVSPRVRRSGADMHQVVRRDGVLQEALTTEGEDEMSLDALREAVRRGIRGGAR